MGNSYVSPEELDKNDIENNYNTVYNSKNKIITNSFINNIKPTPNNIIIYEKKYERKFKNIKERTITINENILAIIYKKPNEYGDFNYMIKSGNYDNVLFLFDDNKETYNTNICGPGIAKIRIYNEFSNKKYINSAGIIVGYNNIGFNILNEENKNIINMCFEKIKDFIIEYKYKELYYSCDENGFIKTYIPYVDKTVIDYVTKKISSLTYLFEKV